MNSEEFHPVPYHVIRWSESDGRSGVSIQIQMVHPDGFSRGIVLKVPDEFLVATAPGEHFIHYRLRRDDLYEGERDDG